tara:strand:- start:35471 stop:35701 length:231 start_codon:yes stop_codon:yes gene_type:complete
MNNSARRITATLGSGWQIYQPTPMPGMKMLGTVARPTGEVGALARTGAGILVQINAGRVRTLDQRKAEAAVVAASG